MLSSLTENDLIPEWAKQRGLNRCFIYIGPSMRPTFQPGHLLYVRPLSQVFQPGDVLIFQDQEKEHYLVHRAVALTQDGWIMRGDNNRFYDSVPVPLHHVIGRVELAESDGNFQPILGGIWGLWRARLRWSLRSPVLYIRRIFGRPYRALRSWPALRYWLGQRFAGKLQTIRLETPHGPIVKTLWRGRVVARWQPMQGRFECRKPFDLFINTPNNYLDKKNRGKQNESE
jgi:signal peptidase I